MRNLKKILALVLALVMSLSLMATASATDFKDDANVGETYRVAVDVLSDLSVFGGDQNGNFNPADPIRRSEVAAIIYRIATGDTGSEGHKSYTPYNQFADVVDGSWYAGYVTYCANAGYIKGRNDGNFHPNDNVTGYEVLAMILRAVGYDKNNEFVGSNWQTNTASIATQRGVLKNLTGTTLLSQPATREVVAELLFRSIMLQQVTWNANSLSYSDNGATLAKQNLNMEAVTGVVMGNERGNLEGTSVLAEGKTSLLVNGETSSRTLNVSTDLTVIGESRSAYIQGSKVLGGLLEDAGNDVKDNEGAETTVEKLRGGLNVKDAQHFENFADEDQDTSEWLIRYVVENSSTLSSAWVDYFDGLSHNVKDKHHVVKLNAAGAIVDYSSTEFAAYEVSIQPDTRIPATDKNIMKAIFSTANRTEANPSEKPVNGYVYGEVYVGTSSLEDKSDIMSWNKFVETYLVAGKVKPITEVGNGNWLKIIDNNGDGKAEYVLHTAYTLDEVADSATRNGTTTYFYNGIDSTDYKFIYLNDYAPAVGDIVLYAVIDGTIQIHKADTAKGTFKAVNYKERQATDVNGDVKEQSDIYNYTRLPQILTSVNENVEYDLYLDDYGYVRAYNNKTSYALVTEVYNTNRLNQGWVTGRALTAEVAIAGENAIREYPVLNSSYYNDIHGWNPFYIGDGLGWNPIQNSTELNYLKPATHMLGTGKQGNEFIFDDNYFNNPVNNERRTWTNVAEYIMGENGINLYTAAKVRNEIYNEVDTDYIQLDIRDISAKDPLYVIDDDNYPKTSGDASAQDNYVRAVDDTQFFAVDKEGHVRQWVGYRNTLTLDADVNNIHAMYAVATNTNANRDDKTYWVADVIVIEVEKFDSRYESISLIYSNNTKISGDVKYLQALDNAKGEIGIIPNNVNIWNGQFTDYGFYGLTNIKVYDEENKLYTADINRIHSASGTNHADGLACGEDYGIYFGVVRSRLDENYYSDYITADVLNNKGLVVEKSVTLSLADFGGAYSITKGGKNYTDNRYNDANWMTLGGHASNRVDEGDYILWAEAKGNSSNKVGFIVDISDKTVRTDRSWENADFIGTVAAGIANEQTTTPVDPVEAAKTAAVNALNVAAEAAKAGLDKDAPDYDAKVAAINAALEAALTKVNEADTAAAVETAKTEGLKAIEEAKGDVPASEFALTLTIGENVTKVTVTVTEEGKEPVSTDYTETPAEAIKVPAGAKVEFAAEYAEGYEALKSAAPIEKMEADQTAEFTAKKIGEVIYTLTVKTDEHVEKVVVTITNGEEVTTEEVTTREQNVSVPENAAVSFEATYAEGYKAGSTVDNIDAMTADREVSFTSAEVDANAAALVLGSKPAFYWADPETKAEKKTISLKLEELELNKAYAVSEIMDLPEAISTADSATITDWELTFVPAENVTVDYDAQTITVTEAGEITISVTCWDPQKWCTDMTPGGDDGWTGGSGTTPPTLPSRARMAAPAAPRRVTPDADGNIPFYIWYIDAGLQPSEITIKSGDELLTVDCSKAETVGEATEEGYVWTFPIKFTGLEYVVQTVKLSVKDNAPKITTKVLDETGAVIPAAEYTLTETHEAVKTAGKTTYDYVWTLTITDDTKYSLPSSGSAEFANADNTSTDVKPGAYRPNTSGGYSFILKGVEKEGVLTVRLKSASTISVTLSDNVTLSIDKDKFRKGAERKDETITLSVTEAYKDAYTLPVAPELYTTNEGKLTPGVDYVYDFTTGVITFKSGVFSENLEIRATAAVKDGVAVEPKTPASDHFTVSPTKVARTTLDKLPVIQIVPDKTYAYPKAVKVHMADAAGVLAEIKDTKYVYDAASGQITFTGTDAVTGKLVIEANPALDKAIAKLNVVVRDGVLEYTKANNAAFTEAHFMLVSKTDSPNLYAKVESIVNGWHMSLPVVYAEQNRPTGDFEFTDTAPTLTKDNKDDFVVVVDLNKASTDKDAKIAFAGIVKVPEITGPVVGPDTVTISDKNLAVTRDETNPRFLNITAKTAGYPVPAAGYTVSVGGKFLVGGNGDNREYNVIPSGDGTKTVIELLTDKTGSIVITVGATSMVKALDITMETNGVLTIKKDGNVVNSFTTYKFFELDSNAVAGMINQVVANQSVAQYLAAIGLNSKDPSDGSDLDNTDATALGSNDGSAVDPVDVANKYLLVLELSTDNVLSAGIVENIKLPAIPTLSSTTATLLGQNIAAGITGTGGRTPYEATGTAVENLTLGNTGGLVVSGTEDTNWIDAVFIPNYSTFNVSPATTWAELKSNGESLWQATNGVGATESDANILKALKCGSDDTLVKNGTIWIQVTDKTDANNCGYYKIPVKFANTGIESDLNLSKPESTEAYVFLKLKTATNSDATGAVRVVLIDKNGNVSDALDLSTVGSYVYALVDKSATTAKIVVTTDNENQGTTTPAGVTLTDTNSNFATTATKTPAEADATGIFTWTYVQSSTAITDSYLTIEIALA